MQTFLVRRPAVAATAHELDLVLVRLRAFEEAREPVPVRWLHSYALRESDGRLGLACVFQARGATALRVHAAITGLPACGILPIAGTLELRALAPTRVHLLRRRRLWPGAAEARRAAKLARREGDADPACRVSWLRSYLVPEDDGSLGGACLFQGIDAATLADHARRTGSPAQEIVPVIGRVVYRHAPPAAVD